MVIHLYRSAHQALFACAVFLFGANFYFLLNADFLLRGGQSYWIALVLQLAELICVLDMFLIRQPYWRAGMFVALIMTGLYSALSMSIGNYSLFSFIEDEGMQIVYTIAFFCVLKLSLYSMVYLTVASKRLEVVE
ncbi:MAG: hypothetical protein OEY58_19610 [Gammaproteobacteria bacterium]|nr:hypothetical protein [Gammaproteobacteria bacterium]